MKRKISAILIGLIISIISLLSPSVRAEVEKVEKFSKKIFIKQLESYGYSRYEAKKYLKIYGDTIKALHKGKSKYYKNILITYKLLSRYPSIKRKLKKYPQALGLLAITLSISKELAVDTANILQLYKNQIDRVLLIYASLLKPNSTDYSEKIKFINSTLREFHSILSPLLELNYYKYFNLLGLSKGFIDKKNRGKYIRWLTELADKIISSTDTFRREFFYLLARKHAIYIIKNLSNNKTFSENFETIWSYYKKYINVELKRIGNIIDANKREEETDNLLRTVFLWDFFEKFSSQEGYSIVRKSGLMAAILLTRPEILYNPALRKKLSLFFRKKDRKREAYQIFAIYQTGEKNKQKLLVILEKLKPQNIEFFLRLTLSSKSLKELEKKLEKFATLSAKVLNYHIEDLKDNSIISTVAKILIPSYLRKIYSGIPLELSDYLSITIDVIYAMSYFNIIKIPGVSSIISNLFGWNQQNTSFFSKILPYVKELALTVFKEEIEELTIISNILSGKDVLKNLLKLGWSIGKSTIGVDKVKRIYRWLKKRKKILELLKKIYKVYKKYGDKHVSKIVKFLYENRKTIEQIVKIAEKTYNYGKIAYRAYEVFSKRDYIMRNVKKIIELSRQIEKKEVQLDKFLVLHKIKDAKVLKNKNSKNSQITFKELLDSTAKISSLLISSKFQENTPEMKYIKLDKNFIPNYLLLLSLQ